MVVESGNEVASRMLSLNRHKVSTLGCLPVDKPGITHMQISQAPEQETEMIDPPLAVQLCGLC